LKKSTKPNWQSWTIVAVIIALSIVRIFATTVIPKFNYDESRRADTIRDVLDGSDSKKATFNFLGVPFFVRTDAGFSSLPFLAPATIWAFFFGTSSISFRIFIAVIVTSSLILLSYTISIWYKHSRKIFLLAACIALSLPWLFLQGILFWDTSLAPVCFIVAFYAFTKIKFAKKPQIIHQLLLPLSLIISVYLYLPSAIPAVILYFATHTYLKRQNLIKPTQLIANLIISCIAVLPFIIFFISFPDANTRTGELSIFYQTDIFTAIRYFIQNLILLINPIFLFVKGDSNLTHSIGCFGMLGTFSIAPIAWSVYYRIKNLFTPHEKLLFVISLLGIASATISSALTHPAAQPHSLRANSAAPFYVLLITLGVKKFIERHPEAKVPVFLMLAIYAIAYFVAFFFIYPAAIKT
jgi:hypothetical protein